GEERHRQPPASLPAGLWPGRRADLRHWPRAGGALRSRERGVGRSLAPRRRPAGDDLVEPRSPGRRSGAAMKPACISILVAVLVAVAVTFPVVGATPATRP